MGVRCVEAVGGEPNLGDISKLMKVHREKKNGIMPKLSRNNSQPYRDNSREAGVPVRVSEGLTRCRVHKYEDTESRRLRSV